MNRYDTPYVPKEPSLVPLLMISNEAASGVLGDAEAVDNDYYSEDVFEEKLELSDIELFEAMDEYVERAGFDENLTQAFREGFSVTYVAPKYQAELMQTPMPMLGEAVANGFIAKLSELEDDVQDDLEKTLIYLMHLNAPLIDTWMHYIRTHREHYGPKEAETFVDGGVLAHNLVRDALNTDSMIAGYMGNGN